MKRRMISFLLCLLLLLGLLTCVSADTMPRVVDYSGLLTQNEAVRLEEKIDSLWDSCQLDVVIVTVDSLDGKTVQEYADEYYDENLYGYGDDYTGILLLLSMGTREWYISTCGEARYIFTDYGLELLGDTILPYLSDGAYYEAFDLWLDQIPNLCEAYRDGAPVDGYVPPDAYFPESGDEVIYYEKETTPNHLISLLIGAVAALVAVLIMRSQMNTAKPQPHAVDYLKRDTYHLRTCRDLYLYSQVTKTRRSENNGSGGGSSVHRSSGGRSHGGRGGKF